jgi:hypothetical protein
MRPPYKCLLAATVLLVPCIALESTRNSRSVDSAHLPVPFHVERLSPSDLEVGGELAGLPPGTTRYITRDDLLTLPQASYTVTGDANFARPTQIRGVLLKELIRHVGAAPESDLIVATCRDQYRANYPRAYIAAHHPLLVLTINGKPPAGWPKNAEGHGVDMGPYMISHPTFTPRFKSLSDRDEPQIPWGVIRIEFRDEKAVFGTIVPRGPHAAEPAVQSGYRIARQNCFRCHDMGGEGGQKSGYPWPVLAAWATASPHHFAAYVHDPQASDPHAQMPGNPDYDAATVQSLIAYFQTFSPQGKEKP